MKRIVALLVFIFILYAETRSIAQNKLHGHGWKVVGKPAPGHEVRLTFAIKQHNPDWLKDKLRAVSYPDSLEYTNYMNFDEIAQHVYGEPESIKAVVETLVQMGIHNIDFTIGQDFAVALVPFECVEEHFDADFYVFESVTTKKRVVASLQQIIPNSLKGNVDFVSGFGQLEELRVQYSPKVSSQNPTAEVTPGYIDGEYNISGYTSSNLQNSQAVAAFMQEYFDPTDLKMFQQKFNLTMKPIKKIVGPNVPSNPGTEATPDVAYISAIGGNVDTWFVSVDEGFFLPWIVEQINTTDSPWVHSVSYLEGEPMESDYLNRVDTEFMKFGVSGRSILFASGDYGVDCLNGKFTPEWPASSPHITSVGGTISLDTVWRFGGGGFSNVFPIPDYQKEAVEVYLKGRKTPSVLRYNTTGRAYPDISAFATNYEYIFKGKEKHCTGTSFSAPVVAGIISLLNDIRLNKGQKTLGFLNPLLYQLKGNGFMDITKGRNNGIGGCEGFEATEGWDPVSGWGSPNFGLLKYLV